jgi:hypothetical protein
MNNKVIKIVILLLAMGVIATVVIVTKKSIKPFEKKEISQFDFGQYVTQKIDKEIEGSASDAMTPYNEVYDIITTEDNVIVDGAKVLSDDNAKNLYSAAFQKYWQIYDDELSNFFAQSSWPQNDRSNIASKLKNLKQRKGCSNLDDIEKYEGYLAGYNNAQNIIKKARNCTSITTYENIRADYTKYYDKYPYSNVTQLQTDLRNAPNVAKENLENYIVNKINKVCNDRSYEGDDNMVRFIDVYEKLHAEAEKCNQVLSSSNISAALNRLNEYYNDLATMHYNNRNNNCVDYY